jgi:hypothetical protein
MRKLGLALALTLISAFSASADVIDGSVQVVGFGADLFGGSDLSNVTIIRPRVLLQNQVLSGLGQGDMVFPVTTGIGGFIDLTDASSIDSFVIDFGGFGKFTADTGQIVSRSPSELKMFYTGAYTGLGTFAPSPMTFRVSVGFSAVANSTDSSSSYNGVLASPAVPEPSTYAMIGLALSGLAVFRRRRVR